MCVFVCVCVCGENSLSGSFSDRADYDFSLPWSRINYFLHAMNSSFLYRIPYSCGKVYIGETRMYLETRIKKHMDACREGELEKLANTEHAWNHHQPILWDDLGDK